MIPDSIKGLSEQLGNHDEDPEPRGEDRPTSKKSTKDGRGRLGWLFGYSKTPEDDQRVRSEDRFAPNKINQYWTDYYEDFALTRAPLKDFGDAVAEPGYQIQVTDSEGERDEDMEEALKLWASNCVIHAGETGHDLRNLFASIPRKRRGKGTALVEKVSGADTDLAALMPLDPSTFKILTRENQPIIVQPDDDVPEDHPRNPDGAAAAYVQYHEDLQTHNDKGPIYFAEDEIIKFVYDVNDGEIWGTSVFEAIDDRIDSLRQKLEDRDYSIRQTGYAHRIYSSDSWTKDEAEEYANAHKEGDMSSSYGPDEGLGGEEDSFAGRVDFVPHTVEIQVETGDIPDLEEPIRDDVEQIFSVMPIGKYEIAYADDLNQFVVEPQREKDDQRIDDERRYLEEKFEPVLEEKADELAGGEYDGEVSLSIEPPKDENPLRRESFPGENLQAFASAWQDYVESGTEMHLPPEAFADLAGIDLKELRDRFDWDPDPLELDDGDDTPENLEGPQGSDDDEDDENGN